MTTSEIRKQFFILLSVAGVIISALILLPFIENPTKEYVATFFMIVEKAAPTSKNNQSSAKQAAPQTNQTADNEAADISNNFGGGNSNAANAQTNTARTTPTVLPENRDGATNNDLARPTEMSKLSVSLLTTFFRILRVLLWFILVVSVIRFFNKIIFNRALIKTNSYELTNLIRNVVIILVYIIAFFVIFQSQFPNIELAPLFTGSTIIGIVVGLALQDTLGNLFSGLAMQADQPFQIGDVITLGAPGLQTGVVENITWRGVKIRTFQNKLIVISNSVLGKEAIEVAPKNNLNARIVFFNTIYTDAPAKTIQAVREAVRQVENVSAKMRPIVRVRSLGDHGIDWEIKYWLDDYSKYNDTDALVRQRVWYVFQREHLRFAYPTRTLYIEKDAPEEVFVERENAVYERLNNVPIFAPLTDEETKILADASSIRVFAPDEAIVHQGDTGGSMFVIHRGAVDVKIKEDSQLVTVNTLREGDFFGEMGLFTGEPRAATVVAKGETEVLQIKKETLKPVFENNPYLVKSLSEIIEERRALIREDEAKDEKTGKPRRKNEKSVFRSIKGFFGLE